MRYIIIIAALFLVGCQLKKNSEKVKEFVQNSIEIQPNGTVDFNQFKSFGWSKLYIIPPYTFEGILDTTLLKYKDEILGTGIRQSDSFDIVILINNEELVSLTEFERDHYHFNHVEKTNKQQKLSFYERTYASFNYGIGKDGYCTFTLPK